MNNFFDQVFDYLLTEEGLKYTNDPKDKGGPTKFGITKRTLENFLDRKLTDDDVRNLELDTAKKIYKEYYWDQLNCGKLSDIGTAICIFTSSVLYGTYGAASMAQKACYICGKSLKIDGEIGDKSIEAINDIAVEEFLKAFHSLIIVKIEFIVANDPTQERFEQGWKNRAQRLLELKDIKPLIA